MDAEKHEDLILFAGAGFLTAVFGVLGLWKEPFMIAAIAQFGALVGAIAMRMKGKS